MLIVNNLHSGYGKGNVLKGINLLVNKNEIVCILGANGAGKSTLLKSISGLVSVTQGNIIFNGLDITNEKPEMIVELGISHVPEGRQIFSNLTVYQNLILGGYVHRSNKKLNQEMMNYCFSLFPILKNRIKQRAGTMSGGEQQMLAIARGLMSKPKLLLLDEPSLGLAPFIVNKIMEVIKGLKSNDMGIIIVEQNVSSVLKIADRGYIMQTGKIIYEGTAEDILKNNIVKEFYLSK